MPLHYITNTYFNLRKVLKFKIKFTSMSYVVQTNGNLCTKKKKLDIFRQKFKQDKHLTKCVAHDIIEITNHFYLYTL